MSGYRFTADEDETIRVNYPDFPTFLVAYVINRTESAVYRRAAKLGLKKSDAYLTGPWACRLRRGENIGAGHRFKKGQTPWNRGVKGRVGVQEACRATQFRKGQMPHNHKPVGYERINADGYLERKVAEPKTFRGVHVLAWESVNGPVPKGHAVVFKRGRRSTDANEITPDAVELVTRAELMRRNSYHNYPQPIPQLIQLRGALQRQINKRSRDEKQN